MGSPTRRATGLAFLCLLLLLAGCEGDSSWHLTVDDLEVQGTDDDLTLSGNVTLGGFPQDVAVRGTRLTLTTDVGTTLHRIPIGTLNGSSSDWTVSFEKDLERIPRCVFIEYDAVEVPEGSNGRIAGYVYTDEGYWGFENPIKDPYDSCQALINEYQETNVNT